MLKRILALVFVIFTMNATVAADEILWYLGAAMSKPGKAVVEAYNQHHPQRPVRLITGGSGQLLSKLQMARRGDLYTPSSAAFLEKARQAGVVGHVRLLLTQMPMFGLSTTGAEKVKRFSDLQKTGVRIALGNPKTMALGRTYQMIEERMQPEMAAAFRSNTILEAINISQIVNYLKTGVVDAGIIFDSVARANHLQMVAIPDELNQVNEAYLIRLTFSRQKAATAAFEDYVLEQEAIFDSFGFKLGVSSD